MNDINKHNDLFEAFNSCIQKLSSSESEKFIRDGIKMGLDTEYKITIKKSNNKDGFTVAMSTYHKTRVITLKNFSGLPAEPLNENNEI